MHWVTQSLISMFIMAGYSMLIPFMWKNFQMPGYTTVTLWMIGASAGMVVFANSLKVYTMTHPLNTLSSLTPVAGVLLAGFVFGTTMNFTITNAITSAPNVAFPVSIFNAAAVVIMFASVVLHYFFSQYFPEAALSWRGVVGVLMVIGGVYLVSTR